MIAQLFRAPSGKASIAANSVLRIATISVKSLLIIALAIWLSPAELGTYGLIAATATLTTYLYGLDFYTFTLRELSLGEIGKVRYRVRDGFALFGVIYVVGGVALAALLPALGVGSTLVPFVIVLVAAQHASLEFYRILIRLERTVTASLCLLIRDAAWVPFCLFATWLWSDLTITVVVLFWLGGSVASCGYGAYFLVTRLPDGEPQPIDLSWLARGVRTGLRMLAGTMSLRGLFSVDRMLVAAFAPADVLGAYVFFTTACASISGLFETSILPFFWPRLLEAVRQRDFEAQRSAQRSLAHVCLVGGVAGTAVMLIGGAILAHLLPNPAYAQNLDLLAYLAVAYLFMTLSNIPHYRLYAGNRDSLIVIGNVVAFCSFVAGALVLNYLGSSVAVPIALTIACALLLATKSLAARRSA